ncbi:hypothetical protein NM688_g6968 [Phlebia brevispora]|uniref:Uncharacterized protein n=1 Tax=Phlebia brevispora TaxID=194682 RepID=A0ACC1SAF7_9APHY|nr:hypothetical protein NM688_g6968 [Phlebia brevispora]
MPDATCGYSQSGWALGGVKAANILYASCSCYCGPNTPNTRAACGSVKEDKIFLKREDPVIKALLIASSAAVPSIFRTSFAMHPSDLIREIRKEYGLDIEIHDDQLRSAVGNLSLNLERACHNLSEELYTKSTHFIFEFIQNADDNTYPVGEHPTLAMALTRRSGYMDISTNEVGFNADNIRAICRIGDSTKKDRSKGFIGEKGIGFKSVFTVADVVDVISAGYAFKFDRTQRLGMIAPIVVDDMAHQPGTRFRLHLSPRTQYDELVARLRDIKPTLVLFLRKIQCMTIETDAGLLTVEKNDLGGGFTRVLRRDNHSHIRANDYLLVKRSVNTYSGEEKRKGILSSDLLLAFPVSEAREPLIDYNQDVHAFLALRSFGLPFIVQADFLTASNREDILVDRTWNKVLRDAIPDAFMDAVSTMQQQPSLKYTWMRYIPFGISNFFGPACTKLQELLRGAAIFECRDGISRRPSEVLILPQTYIDSDGHPLISDKYLPSYSYLSSSYNTSQDASILQRIGVDTISANQFLNGLRAMERDESLFSQSTSWWEKICDILRGMVWQHRHAITSLRLVPLADGNWTWVTPEVFFHSFLTDIPGDLTLKLLGVKEANVSAVAEQLRNLHTYSSGSLARNPHVLPSHAWFLFQHRHEVSLDPFPLQVLTRGSTILPASEVYMDHVRHTSPSLSDCLGEFGAPFLHSLYDMKRTDFLSEFHQWKDWLHRVMRVNIAPRISKSPSALSPEFRMFLEVSGTGTVLLFLKEYAPDIMASLRASPGALQQLREVRVVAKDGVSRPLQTTYIPRSPLTRFPHLPFLDLADPGDGVWDFLSELGVSFQLDSLFYLKQLRELSERSQDSSGREIFSEVEECYKQLAARFYDNDRADDIRSAFKNEDLIYVPPQRHPDSAGKWISSTDAVWDGPSSMRSRSTLRGLYPSLRQFFCEQIIIPPCPPDILYQELKTVSELYTDRPLDAAAHQQVHEILSDLGRLVSASSFARTADRLDWLKKLRHIAFVPVDIPSQSLAKEIWLRRLDDEFYVPDVDGSLASIFAGHVPLLSLPPLGSRGTLPRLYSLFQSEWLNCTKFLHTMVTKQVAQDGVDRTPRVDLATHYRSRVPYMIRTVRDPKMVPSVRSSVRLLEDIGVYEVRSDSVVHTYSLSGVVRTKEAPVGVEIEGTRCIILIGSACPEDSRDIGVPDVSAEPGFDEIGG